MTYFLNPFPSDFKDSWIVANTAFIVPGNTGRDNEMVVAWNDGPYNLTGNDDDGNDRSLLNINFAIDRGSFMIWNSFNVTIDVAAATPAAVTVDEIIDNLNDDDTFSSYFLAYKHLTQLRFRKKSTDQPCEVKFYIGSTGAETILGFNNRAGVADIPSWFSRHTIANRYDFPDGMAHLIELDPDAAGGASLVDDDIIENADLDPSTIKGDWEHLAGRSDSYIFKQLSYDGSNRLSSVVEWQAGAIEGAVGKKTSYTYVGVATVPSEITEEPIIIDAGHLAVTPP